MEGHQNLAMTHNGNHGVGTSIAPDLEKVRMQEGSPIPEEEVVEEKKEAPVKEEDKKEAPSKEVQEAKEEPVEA